MLGYHKRYPAWNENVTKTWTEDDLTALNWCQSLLHGIQFARESGGANSVVFDVDYVLQWDKPQPDSPNYRVASANLAFREVLGLRISIDLSNKLNALPITIDYIERREGNSWRIGFYNASGAIEFSSPGFQQTLTSCLLYTSPSPRDGLLSRMPSSA